MLLLEILNRKQLIEKLTKSKGKLEEREYLISISDPDEQEIIGSKENILAKQFKKNDLDVKTSVEILTFLNKTIMPEVDLWFDKDFKLCIHTDEGLKIAVGLAHFIRHHCPEGFVDQVVKHHDITYDGLGHLIITDKLHAVKYLYDTFGLDF